MKKSLFVMWLIGFFTFVIAPLSNHQSQNMALSSEGSMTKHCTAQQLKEAESAFQNLHDSIYLSPDSSIYQTIAWGPSEEFANIYEDKKISMASIMSMYSADMKDWAESGVLKILPECRHEGMQDMAALLVNPDSNDVIGVVAIYANVNSRHLCQAKRIKPGFAQNNRKICRL